MSTTRALRDSAVLLVAVTVFISACAGNESGGATEAPSTIGGSIAPSATVLAGTTWQVFEYVPYGGETTRLLPGTEITLRFGADGRLGGTAGCNTYQAQFEVVGEYDEFVPGERSVDDGQSIIISALSHSERDCVPTEVLEQETAFLGLLDEVGRWLYARDNQLFLRDDAGRLLLGARPAG